MSPISGDKKKKKMIEIYHEFLSSFDSANVERLTFGPNPFWTHEMQKKNMLF